MTQTGSGQDREALDQESLAEQVDDVADQPSQPDDGPDDSNRSVEQPQLPDVTETGESSGDTIGASQPGEASTTVKDPSDWVTGDEPMTGAQRSYLETLARQAGEQLPADLTKAQASEQIDRLQAQTGRGQ